MDQSTTESNSLAVEVRQALATFHTAHEEAERRIAAAATLKLTVGSNAEERKRQQASMSEQEYTGYSISYHDAEHKKAAAVAHLERCEKQLNTLRDLLNHETAEISRTTSANHVEAAHDELEAAKLRAARYVPQPAPF